MKKVLSLATFVLLMTTLVIACKKDSENDNDDDDTPTIIDCSAITTTFSGNVSTLIATSCAKSGCHASGSLNGPGPLTNYNQIFAARAKIRTAVANGSMPQDATFTAQQKAIITCWIDAGAPNN